jgi:hypothetical protein
MISNWFNRPMHRTDNEDYQPVIKRKPHYRRVEKEKLSLETKLLQKMLGYFELN